MGVGRIICHAILGPLVFWMVIMGAMVGWHFFQDPPALSVQDFPKDMTKEAKENVIKARRPIIKEFMAVLQVTSDIEQDQKGFRLILISSSITENVVSQGSQLITLT